MNNYGWLSPDGEFIKADHEKDNHLTSAQEICKKKYKREFEDGDDAMDYLYEKGWTRITNSGGSIYMSVFEYNKAKSSIIEFVSKNFKTREVHIYDNNNGRARFVGKGSEYINSGLHESKFLLKNVINEINSDKEHWERIRNVINSPIYHSKQKLNGLAQKQSKDESDFNPEELQKGIGIEMEHTDDEETAKTIALDHLTENPKYYTDLENSGIE
jgi:hypothetical protein